MDSLKFGRFKLYIVLLVALLLGLAGPELAKSASAQTPVGPSTHVAQQQDIAADDGRRIRNLKVTGEEPGTLTITWDAPLEYTISYQLEWTDRTNTRLGSGRIGQLYKFPEETSHTLTGLAHGEQYNIRMRARFDDGATPGPYTEVSARSGGGQGRVVTGLTATDVDFLDAAISWNAPSETPLDYQVLVNPPSRDIHGRYVGSFTRTFTTTGPHSLKLVGGEYTYYVRARYADGYIPWGEGVRFRMRSPDYFFGIRDFDASSDEPGTITIRWTKPRKGTPEMYGLRLWYYDRFLGGQSLRLRPPAESTSYTVTGLKEGGVYSLTFWTVPRDRNERRTQAPIVNEVPGSFGVEPVDVKVASRPTPTPTATPAPTPSPVATPAPTRTPTPVAPPRSELAGTVTNVRAAYNNSGDDPITLFVWDEPAAKPRDYEIFVTVPGDSPHGFTRLETHVAIYAAVTDFRIRARYADGHHGPWVEWHDVAVRLLSDLLAIRNFGVVSDSPGVIAAAWDPNLYPPDRYEVYYRLADSAPATRMLAGSTTSTSYEISDSITEDEQYLVWVEAVYDNVFVRETTRSGESLILVERTNAETENRVGSVENLSARVSVMLSDDNPNSAVGLQRFNEIRSQEQSAALGGHSRASGLSEGVRVGSDRSVINYNNSVVLSWDPPRSGPSPDGYRIYRSKYTAGDVTQVDILSADTGGIRTTFTDTTPESITMYGYQVSALLGDEEGEESNEIRLITNPVPNTPTSPVNVSATQNAQGHVVVTWEAPEHIPVGPCTYDVYRDREVNSTELTDLTFTDEQVKPDTYHFYGVWATCGGYKGSSAYVSIRTNTRGDGVPRKPSLPYPNVYVGEPGVKFMFLFDDSAVTQFVISREVGTSKLPIVEGMFPTLSVFHVADEEEPQNEVPFTDTQVIEGSSYNYYIKSKNAQDVLSDPAIHSAKANRVSNRPLGVGNLRATDTRAGRIQLQWNAPDQTGDNPAITGYKIYRQWGVAEDRFQDLSPNPANMSTVFVDNTVEWSGVPFESDDEQREKVIFPNTEYTYYVIAVNGNGNSRIADVTLEAQPSDATSPTDGSSDGGSSGGQTPEPPALDPPSRSPRSGTSAAATTETTSDNTLNMVVSWVDNPATERVCHADYYITRFDSDATLLARERHSNDRVLLATNPHEGIEINFVQFFFGVVSAHLRSLTYPLVLPYSAEDDANMKVRVWCGLPTNADSVLIGETSFPQYTLPQ